MKEVECMEITVGLIIMALTLVAGEITKITPIPNRYIPLQNLIIATVSSIICIMFNVEGMGVLETIITCVFGTMSAGGIADIKKVVKSE
jgi:Na+/alanine symporter